MAGIVADRRLWLNADRSKVVEDGAEDAAFLLAAPGDLITAEAVELFHLELKDGKVVAPGAPQVAEPEAEPPPAPKRGRRQPAEE